MVCCRPWGHRVRYDLAMGKNNNIIKWFPRWHEWSRIHVPMLETQEMWVWSLGWEDPWRREWIPTPIFLPEEFHGQRSLVGDSPWGGKELDMTEWLTLCTVHFHFQCMIQGRGPQNRMDGWMDGWTDRWVDHRLHTTHLRFLWHFAQFN